MAWNRLGALQIPEQKVRYEEYLRRKKYGLEKKEAEEEDNDDEEDEWNNNDDEWDDDDDEEDATKKKRAAQAAHAAAQKREEEEEKKAAEEKEKEPVFPNLVEAKRAGGKMVAYIVKCGGLLFALAREEAFQVVVTLYLR